MSLKTILHSTVLSLSLGAVALSSLGGCKKPPPPAEAEDEDEDEEKSSKKKKKGDSDKGDKGDKSDKPKKAAAKTPDGVKLTFTAKSAGSNVDVAVSGIDAKGEISCFGDLECALRLEKLPDDTKLKVGAQEATSANGRVTVNIPMGDVIAKASPGDALKYDKKLDPEQSVELTFADGVKVTEKLPPLTTKYLIESFLKKKLPNGTPVLFGKEVEVAQTTHTILNLTGGLTLDDVMGPAKTMTEVDWVAVETRLPKRPAGKKCTGYKSTGEKGPGREADLFFEDWEVKIVERRTGKVIETKKFEANDRCPMFASGNEATTYPDSRSITMWLRGKR
jgi:hypothetical protein